MIDMLSIRPVVVSYRNSTSNHNPFGCRRHVLLLYLIEILHQTTTYGVDVMRLLLLYLIEILHQTTTLGAGGSRYSGCILSKFYIKPQLLTFDLDFLQVVSYRNSTSNHNLFGTNCMYNELYLIEILHQTTTERQPY